MEECADGSAHSGEGPKRAAQRRQLALLASAFVAGGLVYATTRSPIAGAVLPSAFAARNSIVAGLWVRRFDPSRAWGNVFLLFYVANACWRAAAAAFVAVVGFAVLAHVTGRQPEMDRFAATMFVLLTGVLLNTVLGLVATAAAIVKGIRVWVDPRWPDRVAAWHESGLPSWSGFNHATFVVGTAVAVPFVFLCGAALLSMPANGAAGPGRVAVTLATIFVPLLAMIPAYAWVSNRVVAARPDECWPFREQRLD